MADRARWTETEERRERVGGDAADREWVILADIIILHYLHHTDDDTSVE